MKKINIPLPSIEGIVLKSATIDMEKGIVVAEYGEKEDTILVPINVGIYAVDTPPFEGVCNGDSLLIGFNENKQLLGVINDNYIVDVHSDKFYNETQCLLTPCNPKDLKIGDTAFRTDGFAKVQELERLSNYCKIIEFPFYAFVENGNVKISDDNDLSWYKVIPINNK